jgi:hypothetical protein
MEAEDPPEGKGKGKAPLQPTGPSILRATQQVGSSSTNRGASLTLQPKRSETLDRQQLTGPRPAPQKDPGTAAERQKQRQDPPQHPKGARPMPPASSTEPDPVKDKEKKGKKKTGQS